MSFSYRKLLSVALLLVMVFAFYSESSEQKIVKTSRRSNLMNIPTKGVTLLKNGSSNPLGAVEQGKISIAKQNSVDWEKLITKWHEEMRDFLLLARDHKLRVRKILGKHYAGLSRLYHEYRIGLQAFSNGEYAIDVDANFIDD
jgi:hypothetical protein